MSVLYYKKKQDTTISTQRSVTLKVTLKVLSLTIMGHLKGGRIENIIKRLSTMLPNKNYVTIYEKKPRRRAAPESSLVVSSMGPSSSGRAASLLPQHSSGGTRKKCLPTNMVWEGECLLKGGFLTLPIWAPWRGDREVGQA